jgi:hypothetical protein
MFLLALVGLVGFPIILLSTLGKMEVHLRCIMGMGCLSKQLEVAEVGRMEDRAEDRIALLPQVLAKQAKEIMVQLGLAQLLAAPLAAAEGQEELVLLEQFLELEELEGQALLGPTETLE